MFQDIKTRKLYADKAYAKEVRTQVLNYLQEEFPEVRNLKCKIYPPFHQIKIWAKYKNKTLYAKARRTCDCFNLFVEECNTKVLN